MYKLGKEIIVDELIFPRFFNKIFIQTEFVKLIFSMIFCKSFSLFSLFASIYSTIPYVLKLLNIKILSFLWYIYHLLNFKEPTVIPSFIPSYIIYVFRIHCTSIMTKACVIIFQYCNKLIIYIHIEIELRSF